MSGSIKMRSVGRLSRLGTGLQLSLTIALAVTAVLLVNWLVGRPGIRQRFDLTSTSKNTLSTAMEGLLRRLEDEVTIEILYRPEAGPRMDLDAEVMMRTEKLLALIDTEAGDKIGVEVIDRNDVQGWEERRRELRIQGFENGLVVSRGKRVAFVPLDGKLAQFEHGRVTQEGFIPPRVMAFNAEESIAEALLDVTRGDNLNAYFTFGYGELDALEGERENGMGLLTDELLADGIESHRWNLEEDGELPEDCDVLVVIGPDRAWPEAMYSAIIDYVERGGRLVVAPHLSPQSVRNSDVPDLLEHFGLEVSEGRICRPVQDRLTGRPVDGVDECELHVLTAAALSTHPMLRPFKEAGVGVVVPLTHQIRVRAQPSGGVAQHLLTSTINCWLDAAPVDRRYDPRVDGQPGEFPMAATVQAAPMKEVPMAAGLETEPEVRVVAIGSTVAFSNVGIGQNPQFLRAVFNWVTDREHRISVPARDPDLRFLPRDDDNAAFVTATRFAQFYLPGAAFLVGLLVWWLRSRGSRRRPASPSGSPPGPPLGATPSPTSDRAPADAA